MPKYIKYMIKLILTDAIDLFDNENAIAYQEINNRSKQIIDNLENLVEIDCKAHLALVKNTTYNILLDSKNQNDKAIKLYLELVGLKEELNTYSKRPNYRGLPIIRNY